MPRALKESRLYGALDPRRVALSESPEPLPERPDRRARPLTVRRPERHRPHTSSRRSVEANLLDPERIVKRRLDKLDLVDRELAELFA